MDDLWESCRCIKRKTPSTGVGFKYNLLVFFGVILSDEGERYLQPGNFPAAMLGLLLIPGSAPSYSPKALKSPVAVSLVSGSGLAEQVLTVCEQKLRL